ncbi:MAG: hypothetical protein PHN51_01330 [Candidatus Nanopelagicales bacterium]|nr:hypothetical protein [Candidatus Nanopelagicales bacterium]
MARCTRIVGRHPELRSLITDLRARPQHRHDQDDAEPAAQSSSSAVRALSTQLKQMRSQHQSEVQQLRHALATAQAENLELRRRLGSG